MKGANTMNDDDSLKQSGILGMHWGQRKTEDGIPTSTHNLAKKDAQRHIDAKMFYGETAGTKRKLLKAELDKKKKDIPGYEQAFNAHLENVDKAKSAQKAVNERSKIDTIAKGRSLTKKVLGVTGSLTVGVATMAYYANKAKVDSFVAAQAKKVLSQFK
jgi:hypothetical protein